MSVKSMHEALMEMAQNQSEAVAYNTKAAKSRLDDRRETNSRMLKRDFKKSGISHIHSTKTGPDGSKYDHFDIGKHTKVISTHNSYKVLHKGKETHFQGDPEHRDNRNRVIDKVLQHVGKNESVKMQERASWVPESIADEKVEAFMEAAIAAVQEGKEAFVFEAKHYKAKSKAEAKKLDPVGKADADIDNDGDVDSSDEYLKNRRKAIKKSMAEEMDPTDHVKYNDEMKMYCVYDKDSKVVAKFEDEKEANAYAIKNHDALMGKDKMDEAAAPGSTAQHGPNDATSDTYQKQMNTGSADVPMGDKQAFVDQHKMEVGLDAEQEYMKNKAEAENVLKQTPPRMGDQRNGDTSFVNPIKAEVIDGITKALQQMKTNN